MRITIVTFSAALGDTLQIVPALRALRTEFHDAQIHLCGSSGPGSLLKLASVVDTFASSDDPMLAPLATGKASGTLPAALAFPDLVIAYTSRTEEAKSVLGRLKLRSIVDTPHPRLGEHAAQHLLRSLTPLGIAGQWSGPQSVAPLDLPENHNDSDRIIIHPGSGAVWKCAPAELFQDIAHTLLQAGRRVVVLQGPADEAAVKPMGWSGEILSPDSIIDLANQVAGSAGAIGNDSGATHLAALLGIPTVALFGPTHPDTWGPMGPRVEVVRACTKPPATKMRVCDDPHCLDSITVDVVVQALKRTSTSPSE